MVGNSTRLGVVQARPRKNRPEADITFIAPSLEHDPDAVTTWYRLLSEATNSLGELGVQRLYAQLPGGNGAEEVFRQAGFSVFTHEDVYLLTPEAASARATVEGVKPQITLRRMRKRDAWNVLRFVRRGNSPRHPARRSNADHRGVFGQVARLVGKFERG